MSNAPLNDQDPGQPANDAGYAALMAVKPGEKLKKARKNKKLDLEAAAGQLNLSVGVLKALENDDYQSLPSSTFVKGYIRSYARMLQLSGDDLVRAFEYQTGVHSSMDEQHPLPETPQRKKKRNRVLLALALMVVIAVLVSWLMSGETEVDELTVTEPSGAVPADIRDLQQADNTAELSPEKSTAEDQNTPEGAPLAAEEPVSKPPVEAAIKPIIETPAESLDQTIEAMPELKEQPALDVGLAPEPEIKPESESEPQFENVETPSPVIDQPVVAELEVVAADPAPAKTGRLVMAFSEDCWVEIRDINEKLIHADLHRAGSRYSKTLAEPFDIKLGNGNVVEVFYNDNPVVFARSKRSNVARLTIGSQ